MNKPIATLALLLVIAALWATFRGFERLEQMEEPPLPRHARYELMGAEWTRYDAQGRPQLHATADTIRYFDDKSAELEHLLLDHVGSTPGPWHLTAPRGLVPPNEQRLQLTEPVKMIGELRAGEPLEVTTSALWVDLDTREIYTDEPVTMTSPYRRVDAVGLRADWAGTRLKLLRDVRVEYATRG